MDRWTAPYHTLMQHSKLHPDDLVIVDVHGPLVPVLPPIVTLFTSIPALNIVLSFDARKWPDNPHYMRGAR